jgi:hypothetical protein
VEFRKFHGPKKNSTPKNNLIKLMAADPDIKPPALIGVLDGITSRAPSRPGSPSSRFQFLPGGYGNTAPEPVYINTKFGRVLRHPPASGFRHKTTGPDWDPRRDHVLAPEPARHAVGIKGILREFRGRSRKILEKPGILFVFQHIQGN